MHGGGGISGNGIYNNLKRDSYMPCEAMALSPKYFYISHIVIFWQAGANK